MSLTGEKLRGMARGLFGGSEDSTSATRADQFSVARFQGGCALITVVANTTSSAVTINPRTDRAMRVKALRVFSTAAQGASTDGWTIALKYDDGAGGASTSTISTVPGTAIAANTSFSSTTAPVDIAAGKRLFLIATPTFVAAAANAATFSVLVEYDET